MFGFSPEEEAELARLNTPERIQDYLDTLPFNFERRKETCKSPRRTLREKSAHCMEGALLAAAALLHAEERPLLLDLKSNRKDDDHVITLFRRNGYWGAISKTNHAVLRFRDPIYRSVRELAASYFHEYFLNDTGEKTLLSYSRPVSLRKFGTKWMTAEEDVWAIPDALDAVRHYSFFPSGIHEHTRPASLVERRAGSIIEWRKDGTAAST